MQFTDVPLEAIEPSPSNPRRRRNAAADAELLASVSTYGILTRLLVRPAAEPGKFQVAAGHRRYDAATKLKFATVPVQIREMTRRSTWKCFTSKTFSGKMSIHSMRPLALRSL